MGKFLTGVARIQQTDKKRVWKVLDNELYMDDDGTIYLVPRNFYTDNYTIPTWIAWLGGSPVDNDVRGSHLHDLCCDCHSAIKVNLTTDELLKLDLLRCKSKTGMWICENIPEQYLEIIPKTKKEANDLLYRCMKAAGSAKRDRYVTRAGVCFNIGWFIDKWQGKVFDIELDKIYTEEFWRTHVWYNY